MENKNTFPLLQVSRGLAALLILIFHAAEMSMKYFQYNLFKLDGIIRSGGVDYFFILTGFMIFNAYRSQIGKSEALKLYLYKRFLRVYPTYWLVSLTIIPIYFLVPSFGYGYEKQALVILKSFLLYPQENNPTLPVAWSTSYIVLFYLMFALLIWLKPKLSFPLLFAWVAITFTHFIGVPLEALKLKATFLTNFIFNKLNLEFVLGVFIAYLVNNFRIRFAKTLVFLGVLCLVLSWLNWKQNFIVIDDVVTFSIPAALIMVGLAAIDLRRKMKIPAVLTYLGAASYSIFLTNLEFTSIQYKLIKYFHWTASVETGIPLLVTIIITAMMGCLVYSVVEKPIFMVLRPQTAQESLQNRKTISTS